MLWSGKFPAAIGKVAAESRCLVKPPAKVTVGAKSSALSVRAARAPRTRASAACTSRLALASWSTSRTRVVSPRSGHWISWAVSDGVAATVSAVSRVSRNAGGTCTFDSRYPGADAQPAAARVTEKSHAALCMFRFLIVSRLYHELPRRAGPPLEQSLQHHVEHRGENQTEEGDTEHAGEHRHAHRVPHLGARAAGEHQRKHAHDEC